MDQKREQKRKTGVFSCALMFLRKKRKIQKKEETLNYPPFWEKYCANSKKKKCTHTCCIKNVYIYIRVVNYYNTDVNIFCCTAGVCTSIFFKLAYIYNYFSH